MNYENTSKRLGQEEVEKLLKQFREDVDMAGKEWEKVESKRRFWEKVTCFYCGIALTILVEVIALLVNKGIH